jgi:hypothetical protein
MPSHHHTYAHIAVRSTYVYECMYICTICMYVCMYVSVGLCLWFVATVDGMAMDNCKTIIITHHPYPVSS